MRREESSVLWPSVEARMSQGKALREKVSRASHAEWAAPLARPDPIRVLQQSDRGRLPELLPIRYGRMRQSAFCIFPRFGGSDGVGFVQNSGDRNLRPGVR
jgi:hypothetical protein